jgi:hypothetical protein
MASKLSEKAASLINQDLPGSREFETPENLTRFLQKCFDSTKEQAAKVAEGIIEDRHGANFYGFSEEIFANFLIDQFGVEYEAEKAYPVVPGFAGMGLVPAA